MGVDFISQKEELKCLKASEKKRKLNENKTKSTCKYFVFCVFIIYCIIFLSNIKLYLTFIISIYVKSWFRAPIVIEVPY